MIPQPAAGTPMFDAPSGLPGNLRASLIALVVTNLIPLWGVLFHGWAVFDVIFIFWCENVVIGGFNVLRMLTIHTKDPVAAIGRFFAAGFFTIHYGMFCFVHGIFVIAMFSGAFGNFAGTGAGAPNLPSFGTGMPNPFLAFFSLGLLGGYAVAVIALIVSHGISYFVNYIGSGEYRRTNIQALMVAPYARVVVLHVTIIFGGFLVMALGAPAFALVLLIALKVGVDIAAHLREHRNRLAVEAGVDEPEEEDLLPPQERLRRAIEAERRGDAAQKGDES